MIDLTAAFAEYYANELPHLRGDEACIHVGDIPGCDRAIWSRINGKPQGQPPFTARVQWDIGHDFERRAGESLAWWAERNGLQSQHGGMIVLGIDDDGELFGFEDPALDAMHPADAARIAREHKLIIGHPDFLLHNNETRAVVDTKWSGRFAKAGQDMPYDYLIKTAAYAFALNAPVFTPWIYYGVKKQFRFEWQSTEGFIPQLDARVRELVALYDATEAPAEEPPDHYDFNLCNYCPAKDCGKYNAKAS